MKLLYLMHIPWGWIKQRPHFIAEFLSKEYLVDVFFRKPWRVKSKHLKEVITEGLSINDYISFPFEKIPVIKLIPLFRIINQIAVQIQIKSICKYDIVWITSSNQYNLVKAILSDKQILVYDCMDDELAFPSASKKEGDVRRFIKTERNLLERADLVVFSAKHLCDTVIKRDGLNPNKYIIVNNAIQIPDNGIEMSLPQDIQDKYDEIKGLPAKFMYIGTIERWLNQKLLISALDANPEMNVILIGPCAISLTNHPRIHYLGTIKRDYIFNFMDIADCMIMPFEVTPLIESVNPVKLYEYIYADKAIIAPRYGESEKFDDYAYLYGDDNDFISTCRNLIANDFPAKQSSTANAAFVKENTWHNRFNVINNGIKEIIYEKQQNRNKC